LKRLLKVIAKKKILAIFCMCEGASCCKDNKKKKVHFGKKMDDYTITKDKEQRYVIEHRHKKI
jgi:hypothetical protein